MLLLPVANALGVLGVPKVILVLGLGQPRPLAVALAGLAAVGLATKALPLSTATIRKKKLLAVQAVTPVFRGFHRFHNPGNQNPPTATNEGKKIQQQ
jgi:hypothetical protein